jgi:hypothetical protein
MKTINEIQTTTEKPIATPEQTARYNEALANVKAGLVQLVTNLKMIKDEALFHFVGGYPEDANGWNLWLMDHCPIQPKQAKLYLETVDYFGDVQAVELVRDHAPEIQEIISQHDSGKIAEIKYDRRSNKFFVIVSETDGNGDEVTKKISVEDYIDRLVNERIKKHEVESRPEELTDDEKITRISKAFTDLSGLLLNRISVIARDSHDLDHEKLAPIVDNFLNSVDNAKQIVYENFFIKEQRTTESEQVETTGLQNSDVAPGWLEDRTTLEDSDLRELATLQEDYQGKFVLVIREIGSGEFRYTLKELSKVFIKQVDYISEPFERELWADVYYTPDRYYRIPLCDIQANSEIITDKKTLKKLKKEFANVVES